MTATKKETTKKATTKKATTTTKDTTKATVAKKETTKKETTKKTTNVKQFSNSELKNLFKKNGLITRTNAKDGSSVVYNTFGTQSRVLQQQKAYTILLTNGHKKVKEQIVDCDNDDVARFKTFYNKLNKEDKAKVLGMDTIETAKLSDSELPRERSVKIVDLALLEKFLQYMAGFEENKLVASK